MHPLGPPGALEICTICGSPFHNPPVPREYNRHYAAIGGAAMPACSSCSGAFHEVCFGLYFGFPIGTDIRNYVCEGVA